MTREEYLERMRATRQFSHFGIEPAWLPGEGDVDGFIHDEVVRQFHDPRVRQDGGRRVEWMRRAWDYALLECRWPILEDVLQVGHLVEPNDNSELSFRSMHVFVGGRAGLPPRGLKPVMKSLVARIPELELTRARSSRREPFFELDATLFARDIEDSVMTVDDWYLAYEWVHPWADGNGRSGKILYNWLLGTLRNPVLVDDYFGSGNP